MTPAAFLAAWAMHLAAAASPGPAVLLAARTGAAEGFRTAAWLTLGLGLGALVWAMAALFGLALLFQLAPALFWALKLAGAGFLIWLAVQMWRHARDPLETPTAGAAPRSALSALRLGLLTQLANPKPAVFFGAVFVGTVPPGTSAGWLALLLAAVFLNEVACNLIVARAFAFARIRAGYARAKAGVDRTFGTVLGLLGLRIALP